MQPNIIFITGDHLRADLLGSAGHPIIQTPHLDQLTYHGLRFDQAYSPTPICIPARSIIMSGMNGPKIGLTNFKPGFEIPTEKTIPKLLGDEGYQTKAIGKMHFYPERKHYGFDQMTLWEEGRALGKEFGISGDYGDYESWLAEQGYAGQSYSHGISNNEYAISPWHLPDHTHPTEWIGSEACKQIKNRDWTRPLFLWTSFTAPHPPLVPLMRDLYIYDRDEMPKPHVGDWVETELDYHEINRLHYGGSKVTDKQLDLTYRAFFALVTQIDRQINRIIGTLFEQGMLENTWIVFSSDHGDSLGDHHIWQKSNFLRGSTNIPLIITPPLKSEEANVCSTIENTRALASLEDLLPTFLDIAGASIPEQTTGHSLLDIIRGKKEKVKQYQFGVCGTDGDRTYMVTDSNYKYIRYEQGNRELFFNLREDPNELTNLANSNEPQIQQFREQLNLQVKQWGYQLSDDQQDIKDLTAKKQSYFPYNTPAGLH